MINRKSNSLVKSINTRILAATTNCSQLTDCFACQLTQIDSTTRLNCRWNANSCIDNKTNQKYNHWWLTFDSCYKLVDSVNYSKKYCGIIDLPFPNQVELPNVNGKYGYSSLYCRWTFMNLPAEPAVTFSISRNVKESNGDIFYIEREKYDPNDSNDYKDVSNLSSVQFSFEKIKNVIVHYIADSPKTSADAFTISCSTEQVQINFVTVFIILGILIIAVMICIIILYRCRQAWLLKQQEENELRMLQEANVNGVMVIEGRRSEEILNGPNYQQCIINKNLEELETMFLTKIIPKPYKDSINKFHDNCSICLEAFIEGVMVVKLNSCKHIFHSECLHNSLMKNAANPRCPNCNMNIFEEKDAVSLNSSIDEVKSNIPVGNIPDVNLSVTINHPIPGQAINVELASATLKEEPINQTQTLNQPEQRTAERKLSNKSHKGANEESNTEQCRKLSSKINPEIDILDITSPNVRRIAANREEVKEVDIIEESKSCN